MAGNTSSHLTLSLTAAIRAHLGLSLHQLARYLRVSAGFVTHLEAGRRGLPEALAARFIHLSRLLPPPLGQGPPAAPVPAAYNPLAPLPPPEAWLAAEQPNAALPAPEPLRRRLRDLRLRLLVKGQQLARLQNRAAALAHRRRGLAQLQAATPAPAEAVRYAHWLAGLAADLDRDEPDPAATAAAGQLLAARVAGLRAELAALEAAGPL